MSKLSYFLTELSDTELVNFYDYRYQEFMRASKEKIDNEMANRGMTVENRYTFQANPYSDQELTDGLKEQKICPRCHSSKFYTSSEIETMTYSYASVDLKVDYRICLVCNYSQDKEESKSQREFVGPFQFLRKLIGRR